MIEKRVAINKEQLVLTTESSYLSQFPGYTSSQSTANARKGEEDE
jgi:hypothetical protein